MKTTTTQGSNTMEIGSLISGTLRPQDLIPAFIAELEYLDPGVSIEVPGREALPEDEASPWWQSEDAEALAEELIGLLNDIAPAYTYFGAHHGDGADFGLWPDYAAIEYDITDGCLVRLEAGDEPPESTAEYIEWNDHGNLAYYVKSESGKFIEKWSCV